MYEEWRLWPPSLKGFNMERMNIRYIDELNAFDAWLETNEISTAAVALWYALMQIANKTGWKRTFNATNGILSVKTGGLSVPALHRARAALQSAGRVTFRTRKGKQATEYTIIPFSSHVAYRNVKLTDQVTDQVTDQATDQVTDQATDQRAVHIPRLEKTRLDDDEDDRVREENREVLSRVVVYYQNNIHPIANEAEKDRLLELVDAFGVEWVLQAIKQAGLNHASTIRYVEVMLNNWQTSGSAHPWKEGKQNGKHAGTGNHKANPKHSEPDAVDWSQFDDTYKPRA